MSLPQQDPQEKPISDEDFIRFRELFYRKTGIMFTDNKRYFVDKRIHNQMTLGGFGSFRDYFDKICRVPGAQELESLINAMTVNETYFYREDYQLACMVNSILPEICKTMPTGEAIRIWSMPCSTGEEPYSIALYLLDHWNRVDDFNIEIIASDIDTAVLAKARAGIYAERALHCLPKETISKYFKRLGDGKYQIHDEIRKSVKFTQVNIMDMPDTGSYRNFDIVFCRNLLIYFDDVSRREAAEVIYTALNPKGFACLGHSESMSRISSLFGLRKFPDAIVYQKTAMN